MNIYAINFVILSISDWYETFESILCLVRPLASAYVSEAASLNRSNSGVVRRPYGRYLPRHLPQPRNGVTSQTRPPPLGILLISGIAAAIAVIADRQCTWLNQIKALLNHWRSHWFCCFQQWRWWGREHLNCCFDGADTKMTCWRLDIRLKRVRIYVWHRSKLLF